MKLKRPSLSEMQNTGYLGHFAKDKFLQQGHNDSGTVELDNLAQMPTSVVSPSPSPDSIGRLVQLPHEAEMRALNEQLASNKISPEEHQGSMDALNRLKQYQQMNPPGSDIDKTRDENFRLQQMKMAAEMATRSHGEQDFWKTEQAYRKAYDLPQYPTSMDDTKAPEGREVSVRLSSATKGSDYGYYDPDKQQIMLFEKKIEKDYQPQSERERRGAMASVLFHELQHASESLKHPDYHYGFAKILNEAIDKRYIPAYERDYSLHFEEHDPSSLLTKEGHKAWGEFFNVLPDIQKGDMYTKGYRKLGEQE